MLAFESNECPWQRVLQPIRRARDDSWGYRKWERQSSCLEQLRARFGTSIMVRNFENVPGGVERVLEVGEFFAIWTTKSWEWSASRAGALAKRPTKPDENTGNKLHVIFDPEQSSWPYHMYVVGYLWVGVAIVSTYSFSLLFTLHLTVAMTNETCCTCARLLAAIPPQFNEKTEKPLTYDRQLDCCGRFICGFCIAVSSYSPSLYLVYQLRSDTSSWIPGLHHTVNIPKVGTCTCMLIVLKAPSAKQSMLPPPFLRDGINLHRIHFLRLRKSLLKI